MLICSSWCSRVHSGYGLLSWKWIIRRSLLQVLSCLMLLDIAILELLHHVLPSVHAQALPLRLHFLSWIVQLMSIVGQMVQIFWGWRRGCGRDAQNSTCTVDHDRFCSIELQFQVGFVRRRFRLFLLGRAVNLWHFNGDTLKKFSLSLPYQSINQYIFL